MRQFKNRMCTFVERRRIVLIPNNLLWIFVIAVTNGLPIPQIAQKETAHRTRAREIRQHLYAQTFALA